LLLDIGTHGAHTCSTGRHCDDINLAKHWPGGCRERIVSLAIGSSCSDVPKITADQVDNAVRQLEILAVKQIQDNVVPGLAIAVVFHDKLVYAKGYGVKDTRTGELINADTVFQLASLSKPLGSTVVAALVGEGKISWDSKISDLDPGFAMYDPWVTREITIRDFYAHRSGLPQHTGDLLEDLGFTARRFCIACAINAPIPVSAPAMPTPISA
jgi:CubicO group peptidase (beta-lactamase class C family)